MNMLLRLIIPCLLLVGILTACGNDATPEPSNDNGSSSSTTSDSSSTDSNADSQSTTLSLSDGQYYIIQATGAITNTYTGTNWGNTPSRQLYDSGNYWTLALGSTNRADATEVSMIQLNILKGLEPGSYTITEGGLLKDPKQDTPVTLMNANLRYPDFQILNDEEEFDGTLTIESISDEAMKGSIALTLYGEGGEVQANAIFDVPVIEPVEAGS